VERVKLGALILGSLESPYQLTFILSYLIIPNRSNQLCVYWKLRSSNVHCTTRVPQGSVLRPLLFSIFTSPVSHFFIKCFCFTSMEMLHSGIHLYICHPTTILTICQTAQKSSATLQKPRHKSQSLRLPPSDSDSTICRHRVWSRFTSSELQSITTWLSTNMSLAFCSRVTTIFAFIFVGSSIKQCRHSSLSDRIFSSWL